MQERARELRKDMTPAEKKLCQYLRNGQLDGVHFRKQHAVDTYIVDFFCAKSKLVIEVDGDLHAEQRENAGPSTLYPQRCPSDPHRPRRRQTKTTPARSIELARCA